MLRLVDLRTKAVTRALVAAEVPRASLDIAKAAAQIQPLLDGIRDRGFDAAREALQRFDGFVPEPIWASSAELDAAENALTSELRSSISESINRVRSVCLAELPESISTELATGAWVHTRFVPVQSVGLYVPGGKAVYPSSVIMNAVPAQVAGVNEMVIATPGQKDFGGRAHPVVLATAKLLGITRVLVVGGPTAIGALAYGIDEIGLEPVDLITGPGNIFVAAAKRLVRGTVGIDSEAGTTEILVLADSAANAKHIALDLISQAEHDEAAASVLVTDSHELIDRVQVELHDLVPTMTNSERIHAALTGVQSAAVLVASKDAAIDFANAYATEHLEIITAENEEVLSQIRNAGAVFLGPFSPVALGDYMAGSNHVLPTGGTARFNSGLGVHTFLRSQQVIDYSRDALGQISSQIADFATAERLDAHARAVTQRFD